MKKIHAFLASSEIVSITVSLLNCKAIVTSSCTSLSKSNLPYSHTCHLIKTITLYVAKTSLQSILPLPWEICSEFVCSLPHSTNTEEHLETAGGPWLEFEGIVARLHLTITSRPCGQEVPRNSHVARGITMYMHKYTLDYFFPPPSWMKRKHSLWPSLFPPQRKSD